MTNTLLSETGFWREKHKSPKSILINFKKLNTSPQIKKNQEKKSVKILLTILKSFSQFL